MSFGITPELIELVKAEEGWVDHPYRCPAGYPTIGWGHRIPDMNHPPISKIEGMALLQKDLLFHRDNALRLSPGLSVGSERRLAAITDFIYNCGPAAYGKSILRVVVNKEKWSEAAAQMRKWVWATDPNTKKKFKLAGLVSRRGKTATWLEEG